MIENEISRRGMLASSLAAMCGVALATPGQAATPAKKGVRFVHMSDMHVKPERGSPAGFAASLQSLVSINPGPEFIITGGDHIMDALATSRARADTQWDMYTKVLGENTKLKTYPVIGNHDVWGWTAKEDLDTQTGFGRPSRSTS